MGVVRVRAVASIVLLTACASGDGAEVVTPASDAGSPDARGAFDDRAPPDAPPPAFDVPSVDTPSAAGDGPTSDRGDGRADDGGRAREVCGNGLDDDGNGRVDDGCACAPGTTQTCYPGAPATLGVGPCAAGTMTCVGTGEFGAWGPCEGATLPAPDSCGDSLDQDCSGAADDGAGCVCARGTTGPCYSGPAGTADRGICASGTRTCAPSGMAWGTCLDEVLPRAEACGNNLDDDCNGLVDDAAGCLCTPGSSRGCYPGPAAEAGRGICRPGTQTCRADGTAYTACAGAVGPGAEVCDNRLDDDCDGMTDEGCVCFGAGSSPWQEYLDPRVVCFGRDLDRDVREFTFATVPGETDARWRARANPTINFSDPSTIPGRFCDGGHTGGVFTYFQTFLSLGAPLPTSAVITSDGVDDATQIRVYNSRYPAGRTEAGWARFDSGATTNIAAALVAGRNRVVIIHVDDNPTERELRNVRFTVNGRVVARCP